MTTYRTHCLADQYLNVYDFSKKEVMFTVIAVELGLKLMKIRALGGKNSFRSTTLL
jgi:hypothetical protein